MHVTVISPERTVFDGDAESLVAPAFDGLVGILPRHAPFLTLLGQGVLVVRAAEGERRYAVAGGFVQVVDNVVRGNRGPGIQYEVSARAIIASNMSKPSRCHSASGSRWPIARRLMPSRR